MVQFCKHVVCWRSAVAPPMCGGPAFYTLTNKMVSSKPGCMASLNIWEETVAYDELTIIEHQKNPEFCLLLSEVRRGCVSDESIATLRSRVLTRPVVDHFREHRGAGQSPVYLLRNAMLNSLQSEIIEIACTCTVDKTKGA